MYGFLQTYKVWIGLLIGISLGFVIGYVGLRTTTESAKFPLLDTGAPYVRDQDLLVRFQPLRQSVQLKYSEHPDFHIGLYFEYLPTGSSIVVNNDRAMWPASLIKIPVALAAMKKVERGEWLLTNQLVILDEDKDNSFGDLYKKPAGTPLSIEELLHATLVDSDNTAHFVLLRNLTPEELEEVFFHLGLDETLEALKNNPNATTAIDNRLTAKVYSVFFRSLYNATFLTPENSEYFLEILLKTGESYLAKGLPDAISFAHKTGIREAEGVWADSGIVYLDRRPFILTVMIERKNSEPIPDEGAVVQSLFTEIATEIHSYVSSL